MTIIYIYVALASYNTGYLTLPMNSIENLVDATANVAIVDSKGRIRRGKGSVLLTGKGGVLNGNETGSLQRKNNKSGGGGPGGSRSRSRSSRNKTRRRKSSSERNGKQSTNGGKIELGSMGTVMEGRNTSSSLSQFSSSATAVSAPPPPLRVQLDWRQLWSEGTDAVMDVPIGGVCEILYGEGAVGG
ncbi:hypothetical protein MMC09_001785 [Bachmanniomyces sp. S44760]|nr:hypothetical protein [Bachmanniomyces sp. S44760]